MMPIPPCRAATVMERYDTHSGAWQKSRPSETAGETACPTTQHQQFTSRVGQAFNLPGLVPRAARAFRYRSPEKHARSRAIFARHSPPAVFFMAIGGPQAHVDSFTVAARNAVLFRSIRRPEARQRYGPITVRTSESEESYDN
jgi:hypothetical protein